MVSASPNSLGRPRHCQIVRTLSNHVRGPGIVGEVWCKVAESQSQVGAHVPVMVWCHKIEEKSTAKTMRTFGIERDSHMLEIIVFGKPFPITKLNGDEFLSAWWQAVVCHYTLWKHGIHHRDVSPGNLRVYRSDGRWIGVLNDHDLSSTQRNRPTGNEHTKAVPFVAIDLLEVAAIEGNVSHLYRHDAESFVWVLVWVCLRYRDGKLLRVKEGRLLDEWLTVDAEGCYNLKSGFIRMFRKEDDLDPKIRPSSSHKSTNWKLAVKCLHTLYYSSRASVPDDKSAFEKLLLVNMKCVAPHILHPVEMS